MLQPPSDPIANICFLYLQGRSGEDRSAVEVAVEAEVAELPEAGNERPPDPIQTQDPTQDRDRISRRRSENPAAAVSARA